MATNLITTTTVDDLSYAAAIFNENIIEALYELDTVQGMVRMESVANFASRSMDFPKTPKLAAGSLAEGVEMSYTPFSTSAVTITANEVGIALMITDVLSVSDIVSDDYYFAEAAKAVANKRLVDVTALSSQFSNQAGSSGNPLTEAHILSAITTLQANSVPGPYRGVMHPVQWEDLIGSVGSTITPAGAGGQTARAATQDFGARPDGGLGNLYGIEWTFTAAVPTATAGTDRLGMIVSPRRALGLVEKWGARTEMDRSITLRAVEMAITANYGTGEIDDVSGVGVISSAT